MLKRQTGVAGKQQAVVAVTQVDQKVGLVAAIGKKLGYRVSIFLTESIPSSFFLPVSSTAIGKLLD